MPMHRKLDKKSDPPGAHQRFCVRLRGRKKDLADGPQIARKVTKHGTMYLYFAPFSRY